ncbi:PQQ-binding-like beta-propeller repeat protein [Streptomyces caniscabiei]|uniref:outer membrane protein assembly factor BamB family protein n=1 Tax=Streptomyces caniscabiei TaxID=2746961 RepID=UPI0023DAD624|nr:PQQ-binding-like beta-propeller repeat protein [Streptomyces caniscabiei]MDX3513511.1 PQQ-binding-like beta-propeller repeat protein [Streptomyces caniscabiei]MDX3722354.1 PQQ-binding-like beta-propeller repeat protein [Streptomyces caniscabiei]WEO27378.1 PQQ-binding-like beta-propeller repeat protein [Streptomyces caniscabiei]
MEAFEALEAGDPEQVGRYRIVARLGAGGMGRVYLGRSPGGRAVAVKVVRSELAEDGEFRRRFAREVAAARRVNGVFTAGVVDADPDGAPAWLATAYVPGVALSDAVTAHGPWPQGPVLALGAGLAEALEAIHAADVVHRDLKPSNILLAADGPRVIDFGISVAHEASALTRTGMVVGTPGFMSPEQLTGKPIGPASDVFSLGAVLAFTATGSGPFGSGSGHALGFRVVYEEPDLDQLPPALRSVVARCLAKQPDQRPAVATLLEQLAEATAEEAGEAEAAGAAAAGGVVTHAPTQPGWLPAPVAATLHSRTTTHGPTVPPAPAPAPAPAPSPAQHPDPAPVPAPTSAPVLTEAPEAETSESETPEAEPSPKGPEAGVTGAGPAAPPVGLTRRRALLGLGGAAATGLGFAGWKLSDGDSSAKKPEALPGSSRRPSASPTPTPAAPSGVERWRFATGDLVYASPIVADGVVYIGSDTDDLYALDTETGVRRWTFTTGADVSSKATVADGTVYVGSEDSNLYAVDVGTGKQRWKFLTGKNGSSSPTVVDGVVYVGGGGDVTFRFGGGGNEYEDGYVYAVDAGTGKQRWKFTTRSRVDESPTVVDGVVYACSLSGTAYAVDAGTGKQRWEFTTPGYLQSAAAVVDGVVYISSGDRNLYALDAATGKQRWKFATVNVSAPTVVDGTVYLGDGNGDLSAVDADTGTQRWKSRIAKAHGLSAPTVVGGTAYVGSGDGNLYAVDADTGKQRWKFRTGSSVYSTPAVADGVVYVSSLNGVLYAVT